MRHLKLTIRYDGTDFAGWQTQPGFRTVQTTLQTAVMAITGEPRIIATASGRTDSGVHALGQVVGVYTMSELPCDVLVKAVNSKLPEDVAVLDCCDVPQAFDPIRDAMNKMYRYIINDSPIPDPFLRKYAWQPRRRVDAALMHAASQHLHGRHDFRSFETHWPNRMTSVRTITHAGVERVDDTVRIEVAADGFLYNMVRSITGTLYQIGRGYWQVDKMREIIEDQDRRVAGMTAPPQGLFMVRVQYS